MCLSKGTVSCGALRCLHYVEKAQDIYRLRSTCLHVRLSCEARLGAVGSLYSYHICTGTCCMVHTR